MADNYSFRGYDKEHMARVIGRSLPVSFKQSVEICNFIRNKEVGYVKDVLKRVVELRQAIPFRRFRHNIGHKTKIGVGRYPGKASKEILKLISSAEANAQFKGLNTANLVVNSIIVNKASKTMRIGSKRTRRAKRTNIEIVVQEKAAKTGEKDKNKQASAKKMNAAMENSKK
ncbi:MAG: 50S ribosomal protein L22 [Nanoarchaeota archaeon]